MSEKKFIKWWARQIDWQRWSFFNIRIHEKSILACEKDDEGYFNITMSKLKEPKEKWYTHYLVENTYKKWESKKSPEQKEIADLTF